VLKERSWWIPGWLEKILPDITIEAPGEKPERGEVPPRRAPVDVPSG